MEAPVRKIKKKKNREKESSRAEEPAAEVQAGKKRKRSSSDGASAQETPAPPPKEEDERRGFQREVQQLVVRLRAEGKSKPEIEAAKIDLKKNFGKSFRKPDGQRAKKVEAWKQKQTEKEKEAHKPMRLKVKDAEKAAEVGGKVAEADKVVTAADAERADESYTERADETYTEEKRKKGLEHKHDVVIIPVTWRGRTDHQDIEKAAVDVKACLAQQGLDVWVDSRRQYTPGQKFAHWEFRGVMLRVEIGPEDYAAGKMRVCRMPPGKEAGDYKSVEKRRLRLPPRGARKLLLTLKEWGLSQIDIEHRPGDDDSDEDEVPQLKTADSKEHDEVGGNWAPRKQADDGDSKKKKKKRTA